MKELSIEEKAKSYDERLAKARKEYSIHEANNAIGIMDTLERIFPELAESEDEKIRQLLLSFVKYDMDDNYSDDFSKEDCIAWLEKQGKKKSIWHNEDEEPQRGSLILLIMQSGNPIVAKIIEPNHTFNHGERWAYIDDLLEKQGEQKPADWIQELECKLSKATPEQLAEWKEKYFKVEPAWSEEDEAMRKTTILYLENTKDSCAAACVPYIVECINWLKSLRPQNRWKPSEGQLECLGYAIEKAEKDWSPLTNNRIYLTLKALKEQLLELRGSKV